MRGQLEAYFDAAFTAPNGVKRLRELILSLAVQGKLTEQLASDEPASELLKKIAAEKKKLEKEGKIKKQKPLPPVGDDEKPYALPKGWEWVRLGNLGTTNVGLTYSPNDISDVGTPVLRSTNIQNSEIDFTELKRVIGYVKDSTLAHEGDLLICARNGSKSLVGKCAIIPRLHEEMAFGAFMAIFRSSINTYLFLYISSSLFRTMLGSVDTVTINQITQSNLTTSIVPLPPLAEQQRIVERVNALMAQCDALEAMHKEQEHKRTSARAAAMHALTVPQGSTAPAFAFSRNWGFLASHFEQLFTTKQDVAELRKTILQLAVMGKLTEQQASDEPASELLKRVDTERKRIAKKDARSKADLQKEICNYDHCVPSHWCQRALADLFLFIDYRGRTPQKLSAGVRLITAKNVKKGFISLEPQEFIAKEEYGEWMTRGLPREGDILFTTEAPMGNAAKVNIAEKFALAQRVINLQPYADLCTDFFLIQFLSDSFQKALDSAATGMTAKGIKGATLKLLPVLIPPLAEQQRIVERVNALIALCDTLEQNIDASAQTQTRLLDAVAGMA